MVRHLGAKGAAVVVADIRRDALESTVAELENEGATGRVLDYTGSGDENRKLCRLYLSLLQRMGVKAERFGDATTTLAGL